jgi:hypothetical protein
MMRCYSVLLVASLRYPFVTMPGSSDPAGYAVMRYVLARDEAQAAIKARAKEQASLRRYHPGIRSGSVTGSFEVEEVRPASFVRLIRKPFGRAYFGES